MSAIPAPLFALVGATDLVTSKARELPEKLAEIEIRRFERPSVDVRSLDPRNIDVSTIDLRKVDPRKVELRKPTVPQVELPKVEFSDVAGAALQFAAKAEQTYEELVTRGEQIVARVRGTETDVTPVATPPVKATKAKATKKATKATTKSAAKTTKPATDTETN
jgi:hypothetical protein